jgi:ankyrin repeat protein
VFRRRVAIEISRRNEFDFEPERELFLFAAGKGRIIELRQLLELGADVATKDENGVTALHFAAIGGHEEVVRLLIENGVDVATRDEGMIGWD